MVDRHRRLLWVAALLAAACVLPGCADDSLDHFREGRWLVTVGRWDEAIEVLEDYLAEHPRGAEASRASFFIANAHIGRGDLDAAARSFEATVRDYPDSLEANKSRYKLAMIDLWSGRHDRAEARFAELAATPDGPLAPEARAMCDYLQGRRTAVNAESPEE